MAKGKDPIQGFCATHWSPERGNSEIPRALDTKRGLQIQGFRPWDYDSVGILFRDFLSWRASLVTRGLFQKGSLSCCVQVCVYFVVETPIVRKHDCFMNTNAVTICWREICLPSFCDSILNEVSDARLLIETWARVLICFLRGLCCLAAARRLAWFPTPSVRWK